MPKARTFLNAVLLILTAFSVTTVHAVNYTYDPLNRLLEADYTNGQTLSYTYDNGGNLLSVQSVISAFAVEGIVRDANGMPLSGVTVTVNGQSVLTDATGYFQITGLSAGDYTVQASLSGTGQAQSPLTVNTSHPAQGLLLVLQSSNVILYETFEVP